MNEPVALTKRQRDVVCFVGRWLVEPLDGSRVRTELSNLSRDVVRMAGGGPSLDEICAGMGLRSRGSLHKHISALIEADLVEPMRGQHRGVRLTDAGLKLAQLLLAASQSGEPATVRELNGPREVPASDASTSIDSLLPLLGSIAAGRPIEAINESIEIEVPAHLRSDGPCYVLRVKGDSMVDEGILDGDLVVVEHRETARNGEIVVALVDGEEATLKRTEHPALLAADAAEAALRGFAEVETTVRVARNAPFNALAILVGTQTGRGGVMTQCAVEESLGLRLGMKGLTSYAETLSVYGTERTFIDGDDTPWSKAFLASAYASRGIKIRFTSGTGSEALMGHAEGYSMLYLEARCLMLTRGAGSQGVQNGSISCIALPEALPGGVRAVLAENLLASMLGLEVASGNDALASHSSIRKSAKLMLQFIPGTDFIFSGYSAVPKRDNLFGGGNFDAEDFDDYNILQRDMQVDGGVRPVTEEETVAIRRKGAQAIQAVYAGMGFPSLTDEEVDAATYGHSSDDMPERDLVSDLAAADQFLTGEANILSVVQALQQGGFIDVAQNVLEMGRQRIVGDYLQPSAIFTKDFHVLSGINDVNDYLGPGTGYRPDSERWQEMQNVPQAKSPREFINDQLGEPLEKLAELGPFKSSKRPEVVVAVGPAFGKSMTRTINDLEHEDVLAAILTGVAGQGLTARVMRVYHSSDCAAIGHTGARYSGSGIAIGIQSRGTTIIQKKGLAPLNNLELFPQSPSMTLETFEEIGRNAAQYAKGEGAKPVAVKVDNWARLRLIVKTALLHRRETEDVRDQPPVELLFNWEPDV